MMRYRNVSALGRVDRFLIASRSAPLRPAGVAPEKGGDAYMEARGSALAAGTNPYSVLPPAFVAGGKQRRFDTRGLGVPSWAAAQTALKAQAELQQFYSEWDGEYGANDFKAAAVRASDRGASGLCVRACSCVVQPFQPSGQ